MARATTPDAPAMTPAEAAAALQRIEGYEETLSQRVGGMTSMLWGVVAAGIFVSYGLAVEAMPPALLGWLWAPWVAAGTTGSALLWRLTGSPRPEPKAEGRRSVWIALATTSLFLAAAFAAHHLGLADGTFALMLALNAVVAFGITAMVWTRHRILPWPMLVAGLAMAGTAGWLGASGLGVGGQALVSAAVAGAGFFGAGLVAFVRG